MGPVLLQLGQLSPRSGLEVKGNFDGSFSQCKREGCPPHGDWRPLRLGQQIGAIVSVIPSFSPSTSFL